MKRLLALTVALLLSFSLVACGGGGGSSQAPAPQPSESAPAPAEPAPAAPEESKDEAAEPVDGFELALVTDLGTIDDKSFNQGAWEGLVQYADEAGISHKYYQPTEQSDDAYLAAIDLAVKGGAKLIVTPGFLFEVPIYEAQTRYPEVCFILVDGTPHNEDYSDFTINDNVVGVLYAEEQAGFLAGYSAVKEGNTKLGFMGGMAVPAVVRFGHGFIQGADFAAKEMGVTDIQMNYHYTGGFDATPEAQTMTASWYNDGIEIIFGCGGAVGNSVMAAAEASNGKVIGVDIDQGAESATVITSAMKGLRASVYDCVKAFYADSFPGGEVLIFGADNDGVGLPMATSKFENFTEDDYKAVFDKLASGEIAVDNNIEVSADKVTAETVKVSLFD